MMMDPEVRRQFEEFDDRFKQAEKRLLAVGNLVRKAGIPMMVDTQAKLDALIESHTRFLGGMEQLREAQAKTEKLIAELAGETVREIAELARAQKKTDAALQRLLEHKVNGHGS